MTAGYVFGPYVDEVLAMRRDVDDNGTLETFYYLHDDQFNVIALTDAAGEVVERYEYGDFGDPTIYDAAGVERPDKTSAFGNVYMFQGRPYDAETGLYYYRTRYLDPVQGRFISRDTIGVCPLREGTALLSSEYFADDGWLHIFIGLHQHLKSLGSSRQ